MNLPNKISLTRIFLIPLVMFFYLADFIPWGKFIAGIIFIVACVTDLVDGKIARKYNLVTDLGKFLDSIADKVLTMAGLVLLIATPVYDGLTVFTNLQWLGIVCGIIIIAREFAVSALRQIAAAKGIVLAADKSGKIKATIQYVALSLYFFFAFYAAEFYDPAIKAHKTASGIVSIILLVLFGITTILTITSAINYFVKNKQVFADDIKSKKAAKEAEVMPAEPEKVEVVEQKEDKVETAQKPASKAAAKKPAAKKSTAKKATRKKTTKKPAQKATPKEEKPFVNTAGETVFKDARGRIYDELIPQALAMFWESGSASTTMLQKHMGVGYPRASKIVDQMEELGYISNSDGIRARKVLITEEELQKLQNK